MLPALHRPKQKKWRLAEQSDPVEYVDRHQDTETTWKSNYASVAELSDEGVAVLEDQAMALPRKCWSRRSSFASRAFRTSLEAW